MEILPPLFFFDVELDFLSGGDGGGSGDTFRLPLDSGITDSNQLEGKRTILHLT